MRNKKLVILISILGGIALLIILASVIFSVRTVTAVCRNSVDEQLNADVVEAADISFASIFMINKESITKKINDNVVYAEVKAVERVFPDKINLIYYKLSEDIQFKVGETYYKASSSGKVLGVGKSTSDVVAEVTLGNPAVSPSVGSYFNNADSEDLSTLKVLYDNLDLFEYHGSQPLNKGIYAKIDLSGSDVVITTATGVKFDLRCGVDNMKRAGEDKILEQLRIAVEMYVSGLFSKTSGRYIVSYNLSSSYSPSV